LVKIFDDFLGFKRGKKGKRGELWGWRGKKRYNTENRAMGMGGYLLQGKDARTVEGLGGLGKSVPKRKKEEGTAPP